MSNWSLSVRVRKNNPDHHLFNNHGTWWCHFWAIADGIRQQRFRVNLHTSSRTEARAQRKTGELAQPRHCLQAQPWGEPNNYQHCWEKALTSSNSSF